MTSPWRQHHSHEGTSSAPYGLSLQAQMPSSALPSNAACSCSTFDKDLSEVQISNSQLVAQELPTWLSEPQPAESFVRYCHTKKCVDFQAGHCQLHKPMQCFSFHFEGQRRRPPIGFHGQIRYWDTPCEWIAHSAMCPRGEQCHLAHSKDEISYHPAKYKTRLCNGKDCRKAICCFAHAEHELRTFAPRKYSQAIRAAPAACVSLPAHQQAEDGQFNLDTFKIFPCRHGRGPPHDRKLCVFYHNPRDRRRPPGSYSAEPCNECFDVETHQPGRCSKGDGCPKCHNRLELLYHGEVFKQRFCATFPNVAACQRGSYCAFAHSRKEICAALYDPVEEKEGSEGSDEFYMQRFKTLWCPFGVQHDWHQCVYAHTYQDWRRSPKLGYGSEPCPLWVKNVALTDYEERCPHGFRCRYAHGSKEQLYHPFYYKTMPCTDWTTSRTCPRMALCAFYHSIDERRKISNAKLDYTSLLPDDELLRSLQPGFRRPPPFGLDDDLSSSRKPSTESTGMVALDVAETLAEAPIPVPSVPRARPGGSRLRGDRRSGRSAPGIQESDVLSVPSTSATSRSKHPVQEEDADGTIPKTDHKHVGADGAYEGTGEVCLDLNEACREPRSPLFDSNVATGGKTSPSTSASCSTGSPKRSSSSSLPSSAIASPSMVPSSSTSLQPRSLSACSPSLDEGSLFAFTFFPTSPGEVAADLPCEAAKQKTNQNPWQEDPVLSQGPAYIECFDQFYSCGLGVNEIVFQNPGCTAAAPYPVHNVNR